MKKKYFFFIFLFFIKISFAQEDCVSAITLCGNSAINYTPVGIGNTLEPVGVGTCLSTEHHSVWYKFTIATSGTLTFDLIPTGPVDYDWAIFGPNASCTNFGNPIRCNASGYYLPTGMNMTNTNFSSGLGNTDPYCRYMDVLAGETYYFYIDNWNSFVYTFNLTWGGTATFVSPFTNPTLAPNPFTTPGNQSANPSNPNEINICSNNAVFDFSTLTPGILNGNTNFVVSYYANANNASTGTNPITTPTNVNTSNPYYYVINYQDPNNPNNPSNACRQIGSFVFVNQTITAAITASSNVICPNGSVTLSSSSNTGNSWSTGATTPSITVTNPGTYTLTTSNGFCTSPPASITITNAINPNLQINGNLVLCPNSTTTLTASANGTGNTFSWSNGINGASTTISTPGNYTVTVTTSNGCQFQQSATVVQANNPNVQISGNLDFCQGGSTTLTATANGTGNTFSWSNGANGPTNTVSTGGNYTVTVTTPEGCQFQKSVTVTMNPAPIVNIANPSQINCSQAQITLNASGSIYQTGASFAWTASAGGNIVSGGNTLIPVVNTVGNYTLTITNPNGCSSQASVNVTTNTTPPVINLNAATNQICEGESVVLTASGAQTYNWTGFTGTGNTQTVSPTTTTTYSVTGTGANGCQGNTATITINVVPPIVSTLSDVQFCKGETGILDAGSGPNYSYQWSTGETSQIISVNQEGTYVVTIDNGVCTEIFSAQASFINTPTIESINYDGSTLIIIATNNNNQPMQYSIDGGFTWQDSNIFYGVSNNLEIDISVRTNGQSCYTSLKYFTFKMQNVITPNGDGHHDVIEFTNLVDNPGFSAEIYDRYGKLIFKATPKNPVWNGKHNGNILPTSSYWYVLKWNDNTLQKPIFLTGWILLKARDDD